MLDLLTTYVGIQTHELGEGNPVARWIASLAPDFWTGLIALKMLVIGIAWILHIHGRDDCLRFTNYCFTAVIVWNLIWILFTVLG